MDLKTRTVTDPDQGKPQTMWSVNPHSLTASKTEIKTNLKKSFRQRHPQ